MAAINLNVERVAEAIAQTQKLTGDDSIFPVFESLAKQLKEESDGNPVVAKVLANGAKFQTALNTYRDCLGQKTELLSTVEGVADAIKKATAALTEVANRDTTFASAKVDPADIAM